ncbi:hypothetical protein [Cytobacillus sp. FSL R7-0680]|uniref:hypothetical protein n=1 Tax=Cytobacillus sp. FSL R7-0680 TaxID=2921689 RepID=UPI0030F97259
MSKLAPKPITTKPLHSWDYLNKTLQANFSHVNPDKNFLVIDLRDFEMSKEEIMAEAIKQGYKVSEELEHYLRFE